MPNITITDESHWLSVREAHIGGSEVSALFNRWLVPTGQTVTLHAYEPVPDGAVFLGSCSPYTNAYALWLAKAGKLMPEDWNPSERMQAGTYLEPALAEWAKAKWDWKLRKVRRYHSHDKILGWGASVDFEVQEPGMAPVEFKNIDFLIARDNWLIEGEEVLSAPLHINLQLQHYIGARNAKEGWIVACVGGNELVRGRFDAHEATIARISEAVSAFWKGVAADVPPDHLAEYDTVAEQFAYGRAVEDNEARDLRGDDTAAVLARRYMRLQRHSKFIDGIADNIKGRLALKLGEVSKAKGDGFRLSWPVIEREEKMIPARLQAAKTYRGGLTVRATN